MSIRGESDEICWQVVKAMLDEFPTLRGKVKRYIEKQQKNKTIEKLQLKCDFSSASELAELLHCFLRFRSLSLKAL